MRLNILQAIVTAVTAPLLETQTARRQIEFVVDDENFIRQNL